MDSDLSDHEDVVKGDEEHDIKKQAAGENSDDEEVDAILANLENEVDEEIEKDAQKLDSSK